MHENEPKPELTPEEVITFLIMPTMDPDIPAMSRNAIDQYLVLITFNDKPLSKNEVDQVIGKLVIDGVIIQTEPQHFRFVKRG